MNIRMNLKISIKTKNIFAGNFKVFFNSKLEVNGGKPFLKRKPIPKLFALKSSLGITTVGELKIL